MNGYPSAQWQTSVGDPFAVRHDNETTQLQMVLMVSELLFVSTGLASALRIISRSRFAKLLDLSKGMEGWSRSPASRILSWRFCQM